ncbi:MAG: SAM-dependent methyltransferase [Bacteroidia bacterium]|nr:SAM-dependent methyltransferase [Bacteroidia bacterium]
MSEQKKGKLFLIPSALGDYQVQYMLAPYVLEQVHSLRFFLVESEKSGRAAIKNLQIAHSQSELEIFLVNEHTKSMEYAELLKAIEKGNDVGLISDAGLPCVADPGSEVVAMAHQKGIEVIPLPGPSSVMLALMASGFNGQGFAFHGYIPIEKAARAKKIREMEQDAFKKKQTQIFIETPYRNNQLLQDLLKGCQASTKLCVAVNLLQPDQVIHSAAIAQWRKETHDFHKKPAVFLLS